MDYITPETLDAKTDEWIRLIGAFNKSDRQLDPAKSALLVIDCQNFFVGEPEPDGPPILPRIASLMRVFRDAGRPVILTRHMHKADESDFGVLGEWWPENIIEDTWESEIHPALGDTSGDIVLRKNRYSAFVDTGLDEILKKAGVKDIVVTGVMTNLCCETTSRDAFMRDYNVFFPADANATANEEMHFASLLNLSFGFATIVKAKQIEEVFRHAE